MDFNRIANMMSGDIDSNVEQTSSKTGLSDKSSDTDILDYVMVQLCHCLDTKKVAFKGGYILNKIIEPPDVPRQTVDIDFSISVQTYYENVKSVLSSIGDDLIADGIIDSYEVKDTISPTSSGGIKFNRVDSKIKDLGVDVGLHDISQGIVPMSILGYDVQRFSVQRMLSDKISAIYSRKRFRRPKDLYDFVVITNCFDVKMCDLREQVNIRNTIDWTASPMRNEVAIQYKKAYDSLTVIHPLTGSEVSKPEFSEALGRVAEFVQHWEDDLTWKCNLRRFV